MPLINNSFRVLRLNLLIVREMVIKTYIDDQSIEVWQQKLYIIDQISVNYLYAIRNAIKYTYPNCVFIRGRKNSFFHYNVCLWNYFYKTTTENNVFVVFRLKNSSIKPCLCWYALNPLTNYVLLSKLKNSVTIFRKYRIQSINKVYYLELKCIELKAF